MTHYIIGIDEVGRGPIAGPVTVGAVMVAEDDYSEVLDMFAEVKDSKKLSEQRRLDWLEEIKEAQERELLMSVVASLGAETIDARGIRWCLDELVGRCLTQLQADVERTTVLLDGSLSAPEVYTQETIIKGDEKELLIALASIAAKVTRDTYMVNQMIEYPEYGFERHKGYGTKAHFEAIKTHGVCSLHRRTFIK